MNNITPSDTVFFMSSPDVMTDSGFDSIEYGVEVDAALSLEGLTDAETVFDTLP